MGEAIYLAIFIWAIVYLSEFARGDLKALTKCGWCLFGACLTRYDGWFLAVCIMVLVLSRIIFAEKGTAGSKASKRLRIALANSYSWRRRVHFFGSRTTASFTETHLSLKMAHILPRPSNEERSRLEIPDTQAPATL